MRTFKTLQTLFLKRLLVIAMWCSVLFMGAGCQCCQLTEWYADRIDHVADCPWNMEWAYCRRCDLTRIDCRDCPPRGHHIVNCPQNPETAIVHAPSKPKSESPAILQVGAAEPVKQEANDNLQVIQQATAEAVIPKVR